MGCLCTRDADKEPDAPTDKKVYSWDVRRTEELERDNYVIESVVNEEIIQYPGSVDGRQFLIQNCKDSTIYILDHMNTVNIYDCINCKIVLGPVKGSLYIGNCQNCVCVVACGQLRVRDSRKILAFLHCETQPVIEASSAITIGSYQLRYEDMEEHLKRANVNLSRRTWRVVHDFTPLESETNWKFAEKDDASEFFRENTSDDMAQRLRTCGQSWAAAGAGEVEESTPATVLPS